MTDPWTETVARAANREATAITSSPVSGARSPVDAGEAGVALPFRVPLDGTLGEIRRDLAAIEDSLATLCADRRLRTHQAARHVLFSGGKRARPLLTCAVLRALDQDPAPYMDAIAAVELAHAGSLLHDDIIDEAETRRRARCAHLVFDVPTAILAGDSLLVAAIELTAMEADRELYLTFSSALKDLCAGEALERERLFDPTVDAAHALQVNRLKTASLFGYAAEAGAILGGAAPVVRRAVRTYGLAVGEAFQLTDDLLDLDGDPNQLGKPIGMDLTTGVVTLPIAIALGRDPSLSEALLAVWHSSSARPRALAELRAGVAHGGGFDETRSLIATCTERACAAVAELPRRRWRDQLAAFARAAARRAG